MSVLSWGLNAVERGWVPDVLTRSVIRQLCAARLLDSDRGNGIANAHALAAFVEAMRSGPVAPVPEKANEQHYELPPEFFTAVLGARRKYSCCYFADEATTLDQAEEAALAITCERAQIADGQDILELGCGWGSLSLWIAERYPTSRITAVSNSAPQRRFIEATAAERGLSNLRIITADMNDFTIETCFDRVVSVEMFEHMRNYERLLQRIAGWLRPNGKLFVHLFCHSQYAYPFETEGDANWMGRYFFTGGIMPSENLLRRFNRHMLVTGHWSWNGQHYQRTSEAWLVNLDARRQEVLRILEAAYGKANARVWLNRWRMFFLAVAELFGYSNGSEWFVSHNLLEPVVGSSGPVSSR